MVPDTKKTWQHYQQRIFCLSIKVSLNIIVYDIMQFWKISHWIMWWEINHCDWSELKLDGPDEKCLSYTLQNMKAIKTHKKAKIKSINKTYGTGNNWYYLSNDSNNIQYITLNINVKPCWLHSFRDPAGLLQFIITEKRNTMNRKPEGESHAWKHQLNSSWLFSAATWNDNNLVCHRLPRVLHYHVGTWWLAEGYIYR